MERGWVLLGGFTSSLLLLHRKQQDAQAGAGLQKSDHGGQCHLAPGAPASLPQRASAAVLPQLLCASVYPSLKGDHADGRGPRTSLHKTLSKHPRPHGETSPAEIAAALCLAVPREARLLVGHFF